MEEPIPAPAPTVADVADLAERVAIERCAEESGERHRIRYICDLLRTLFGATPATRFGPVALRAVQRAMVDGWSGGGVQRPGLARKEVNRRVMIIRRFFRIAVSYELVPVSTLEALRALESLRAGRTKAPERPPTRPVAEDVVRATLAHVTPAVRAMAELQAATGMRSGEVVSMRVEQIDRSRTPWVYTPASWKGTWRGHVRHVPLGPVARAVLAPILEGLGAEGFVFSPRRQMAAVRAARAARRKRPPHPCTRDRERARNADPNFLHECYSTFTYAKAIARAAKAAGVEHWRPGQLRHLRLTLVRSAFGLDAAQAIAGHKHASMSEHYSALNLARASEIAEASG